MALIDFEFNDKKLSDFGCIIAHVSDSAGDISDEIGVNEPETIQNGGTYEFESVVPKYNNPYSITFQIAKYDCKDKNNMYFSDEEYRGLVRWLTPKTNKKFKPYYDNGQYLDVFYLGIFNISPIFSYGNLLGFELKFTANAPFGFSETRKYKYIITENKNTFSIYDDSDDEGFIYPKLTITCKSSGDLSISRNGVITTINNCELDEVITIDGKHKTISSSTEHPKLFNDFNYEFPIITCTLKNTKDVYTVSLPCEIIVEYSPIRKVGVVR